MNIRHKKDNLDSVLLNPASYLERAFRWVDPLRIHNLHILSLPHIWPLSSLRSFDGASERICSHLLSSYLLSGLLVIFILITLREFENLSLSLMVQLAHISDHSQLRNFAIKVAHSTEYFPCGT